MYTSIPSLHVSSKSKAVGQGTVRIISRQDATHTGQFIININVSFDPGSDNYPTGTLTINTNLNDAINGIYTSTSIELINSYGLQNPTIYLTGRCNFDGQVGAAVVRGAKYWVMIANNKTAAIPAGQGTPDVVGFAIIDRNGNRICYGTGPLLTGDMDVAGM